MIEFIFNCFDICNQILNYTGLYLINKWYEIMKHKTKLPSFFSLPIRDLNDYYLKKIIDWQIQNGDLLDPETRLISLDIKESAIKEQFRRNIPIGIPIGISHPHIIQMTAELPLPLAVTAERPLPLVVTASFGHSEVTASRPQPLAVTSIHPQSSRPSGGQEKETSDYYYDYDFRII